MEQAVGVQMNSRFVSAWLNKKPQVAFRRNPSARSLPLGAGMDNVTSIFATPGGRVLNAVPGYLDVQNLLEEMRFALDLAERLKASGEGSAVLAHHHRTFRTSNSVSRLAHDRLAKVGLLGIEQVTPGYFDDLVTVRVVG